MKIAHASQRPQSRRPRKWLRVFLVGGLLVMMLLGGLVALPVLSPSAGASAADGLRSVFGPEFVAELESASFRIQDSVNRARYQVSGGQPQLNWEQSSDATDLKSDKPVKVASSKPLAAPAKPTDTAVTALSPGHLDWQAYGATLNGMPLMARAFVKPDPDRPYAQAALVRIDLSQVQLHLLPGTDEPVAAKPIPGFKRPGFIPIGDQAPDRLLAAFNGGFKAIHGHYGMMAEGGVTLLPPLDGLATIALHSDGRIQIGAWGRDLTASDNLTWYRQNCPLLVDSGQINPHVNDESRKEWGYTVKNLDTTWRSGLGISQDGRFLIYAAGNSLTVESLAQALQQAGASYAMQIDINGFYTRFVTYRPADNPKAFGHPVMANKLLKEMSGDLAQFLHPYDRDFFYVTLKS